MGGSIPLALKKSSVKPSGPGALPVGKSVISVIVTVTVYLSQQSPSVFLLETQ